MEATAAPRPSGCPHSPLAKLSPELRNIIYELALRCAEPVRVRDTFDLATSFATLDSRKDPLAPTRTCKMIRDDCGSMFYAVNSTFVVLVKCHVSQWHYNPDLVTFERTVRSFLDGIGGHKSLLIEKIVLDMGHLTLTYFCNFKEVVKKLVHVRSELRRLSPTLNVEVWFAFPLRFDAELRNINVAIGMGTAKDSSPVAVEKHGLARRLSGPSSNSDTTLAILHLLELLEVISFEDQS